MADATDLLTFARRLNPGVRIRPATSADATTFEGLMNAQYSRKKPPGYFAWRFEKCPDPSVLMMATEGDELVGCMGGHVRTLTDGRRVVFSVDLVVTPNARNRGLSLLLEDSLEAFGRDHSAIALTAMPNPEGLRAHLGFPGCRTIGFIPTLVQRSHVSLPSLPGTGANDQVRLIGFCHNADYAAWRYSMNPEYEYLRITIDTDASLVYKRFCNSNTHTTFIDILELSTESPAKAHDLITRLRQEPYIGDAAAVTIWALPHTALHPSLSSLGFQPEGNPRAFCLRPFRAGNDEDLRLFDAWNVVESDSEVY